jgi:outer membrane protein OmpA-like peptidoglycan-associated protein
MKALAWIVSVLYIAAALFVWMCPVRGHCPDASWASKLGFKGAPGQTETATTIKLASNPYSEWGDIAIKYDSGFSEDISSINSQLLSSQNQLLSIIGYVHPAERENDTINIALGRAESMKAILAEAGIDASWMTVMYATLHDSMGVKGDPITQPVRLRLVDQADLDWLKEQKELAVFHFTQNSSELRLDDARRAFLEQIMLYLKINEEKQILLTGHTSLQGSNEENQRLGKERAQAIKNYLVLFGASDQQIKVASRGEEEPVRKPEQTEADRKQNRRVVLTFVE